VKVGDLIRGDYTAVIPDDMPRKIWIGIIVAVDDVDNWVEIVWDDGQRYRVYLDDKIEREEVERFWEVVNESR
jgi:hypothetical protein|tara:strand:+ start:404 stop:622 length:219 start_codon:yes stop_codon:yes gene_type:complete